MAAWRVVPSCARPLAARRKWRFRHAPCARLRLYGRARTCVVADTSPCCCERGRQVQTCRVARERRGWAAGRASRPSRRSRHRDLGVLPTAKRAQNRPRIGQFSARRPRVAPVRVAPHSPATRGQDCTQTRQTRGAIPTSSPYTALVTRTLVRSGVGRVTHAACGMRERK